MATQNGDAKINAGDSADPRMTMTMNAMSSRWQALMNRLFDPRRDIEDECGIPKELNNPELYARLYEINADAARANDLYPLECWQVEPEIEEDEDVNVRTPFEEKWARIGRSLTPDRSFHKPSQESGHPIWSYLLKADKLSGVGRYGVILLGLSDMNPLDGNALAREVAVPANGELDLIYMKVFQEKYCPVAESESNVASPRFGKPKYYNITFNDPDTQLLGANQTTMTKKVHWTRIVHIADNTDSNDVAGRPRMKRILPELLGLYKIKAPSAEAYYKNCITVFSLETHPQLGGDVDVSKEEVQGMVEDVQNSLQRWMFLRGMSAKTLAPTALDPTPFVSVLTESVCIYLGCPVRIYKGSERGELASTQDDDAWNDRLKSRQKTHITPNIIIPVIDRLIALKVLPTPVSYCIKWPDLTSQSASMKADVAVKKTTAIVSYVSSGGAESVMSPKDFYTRIMGMDDKEAQTVLENAMGGVAAPAPTPDGQPVIPAETPQQATSSPSSSPYEDANLPPLESTDSSTFPPEDNTDENGTELLDALNTITSKGKANC